jgi:hypothetical protein
MFSCGTLVNACSVSYASYYMANKLAGSLGPQTLVPKTCLPVLAQEACTGAGVKHRPSLPPFTERDFNCVVRLVISEDVSISSSSCFLLRFFLSSFSFSFRVFLFPSLYRLLRILKKRPECRIRTLVGALAPSESLVSN